MEFGPAIGNILVIWFFAVLIGLLLPAVQKLRQVTARMHCQNTFRRLIMALEGTTASKYTPRRARSRIRISRRSAG